MTATNAAATTKRTAPPTPRRAGRRQELRRPGEADHPAADRPAPRRHRRPAPGGRLPSRPADPEPALSADGQHLVPGPRHRALPDRALDDARHLPGLAGRRRLHPTSLPVPDTAGHLGAPVERGRRPRPVILFSHGAHDHRSDTTTVVQELVSHGYVVATVDHTYDAFTQFPGGPVLSPVGAVNVPESPSDFAADLQFLLDTVHAIAAGHNPDVDRRPLPDGPGRQPGPGAGRHVRLVQGRDRDRPGDHGRRPGPRRAGLRRPDGADDHHRPGPSRS